MAQFRIEFVLDQSTGKYLAEMYHPDRNDDLLVRTEALYPTQAAAVLGVVQLFKNAVLQFPPPGTKPRKVAKAVGQAKKPKKKPAKAKKPVRKSTRSKKRK